MKMRNIAPKAVVTSERSRRDITSYLDLVLFRLSGFRRSAGNYLADDHTPNLMRVRLACFFLSRMHYLLPRQCDIALLNPQLSLPRMYPASHAG